MKVKIFEKIVSTNNDDFIFDTYGTKKNNIIEFNELETNVKIVLNKDNITLKKNDKEKEIIFDFKNNNSSCSYYFKELDLKKELTVFTNELYFDESELKIDYDLKIDNVDMGNFKISIKCSNK